jgi:hypothetical protein
MGMQGNLTSTVVPALLYLTTVDPLRLYPFPF